MFNRKEFNERIQQEFEDLRELASHLDGEEVFDMAFEINFKRDMAEYLVDEESTSNERAEKLNNIDYEILDFAFEIFLNLDINYNIDAIEEFVSEFEEEYDNFDEDGEFENGEDVE